MEVTAAIAIDTVDARRGGGGEGFLPVGCARAWWFSVMRLGGVVTTLPLLLGDVTQTALSA